MATKTTRRTMVKTSDAPADGVPAYVWFRFPLTGLQRLEFFGHGNYPYDCDLKRKHPRAAVYVGETCWTTPVSSDWGNRVKELDGKAFAEVDPAGE